MKKYILTISFIFIILLIPNTTNINAKENSKNDSATITSPAPWNPEFMNYDAPDGYYEADKSTIGTSEDVTITTGEEGSERVNENKQTNNEGIYTTSTDKNRTVSENDGKLSYNERRWEDGVIAVPLQDDTNSKSIEDMSDKVVTIMYPDAIFINGNTYNVEAQYSNFVKVNDVSNNYSTLDLYNKIYDGFWLEDLDETTVRYQIQDHDGNIISPAIFEDLQVQMWSLNSQENEPGEYVAPVDSVDSSKTEYYNAKEYSAIKYKSGEEVAGSVDAGEPENTAQSVSNEDKGVIYHTNESEQNNDSLKLRVGTTRSYDGGGRMWAVPTIYTPNPEVDTIIQKSIVKEDGQVDGVVENGETVTYNLAITNDNSIDALNVPVRDSILENLGDYPYITYNNDIAVDSAAGTGDVTKGEYVLDDVPANSTVNVTYSLTFVAIPSDITDIDNLATDNNDDPQTCNPDEKNCSEASIPKQEIEPTVTQEQPEVAQPTEMPHTSMQTKNNFLSYIPIVRLFV